jgi:hypothetical protein
MLGTHTSYYILFLHQHIHTFHKPRLDFWKFDQAKMYICKGNMLVYAF